MSAMHCVRFVPATARSARCTGFRAITRVNSIQKPFLSFRPFSEQPQSSNPQTTSHAAPSPVPPVSRVIPFDSSNAGDNHDSSRSSRLRPMHKQSNALATIAGGVVIGAALGFVLDWILSDQPSTVESEAEKDKKLPEYTMEEVAKHRTAETGIWVTYQGNVYDITKFVATHPGGTEKIMLAAGTSLEPFWSMYQQHNTDQVKKILSQYLIGHVKGYKAVEPSGVDPFASDPHNERHPALRVITPKPFNAETPPAALSTAITPTELFYIRNHLPVPIVDEKTYKLEIAGEGVREVSLTLDQLRTKFKKHTVVATLQCAGNRRHELAEHKSIRGLDWHIGAIGTAEWGGVLLRDVLEYAGMQPDVTHVKLQGIEHVQFEGLDKDPTGATYGASIPVDKAIDSQAEVLLAFEMNGKPLSRDHGFPVRVIVPGVVGARHVKWLRKIAPSRHESQSHWQQKDYKSFAPGVDWDSVDWKDAPAIQDMPVQSAITEPSPGKALDHDAEQVNVKGYAWSGAGRDIIRVDVSADGGKTWSPAAIQRPQQAPGHVWGTTPFSILIDIPDPKATNIELVCKAVDSSYNTQPDSIPSVWNLRGVVNNAWHRVHIKRGADPNAPAQPASALTALTGAVPAQDPANAPKA